MRKPRRSMSWAVSRIQQPTVWKVFPSNPIAGGWFWVWTLVVVSGGCYWLCWIFGTKGRGEREVSDAPLTTRYFTFFSEISPHWILYWNLKGEVTSMLLASWKSKLGFCIPYFDCLFSISGHYVGIATVLIQDYQFTEIGRVWPWRQFNQFIL